MPTGFVSVPLPGPGSYAVEIEIETLPEGIELVRADKQQLPVEARSGQPTRVLFNLAEGDAAGAARDKTSDSLLTRAARLLFEGIIFGLIIGLCAIGLSLIYGTTGLVNFALSEQIVFGALVAYFFNAILGINLIPAALIAFFVGGIGSAFLDIGLWRPLRKRGTGLTAMMIISIGLALFLRFFFLFLFGERSRPYDQYAVQTDILFTLGPVDVLPKELLIIVVVVAVARRNGPRSAHDQDGQGDAGRRRQQRPRRLDRHRRRPGGHHRVVRRRLARDGRCHLLRSQQPDQLADGPAAAACWCSRRSRSAGSAPTSAPWSAAW